MSLKEDLQAWADEQPLGNATVNQVRQVYFIEWRNDENPYVSFITIEDLKPALYIIDFQLVEEHQQEGIFKSFAVFIARCARENDFAELRVIAANELMLGLLNKCGFKRGNDPDDYFVDISMEDSPPEKYGNSRP